MGLKATLELFPLGCGWGNGFGGTTMGLKATFELFPLGCG